MRGVAGATLQVCQRRAEVSAHQSTVFKVMTCGAKLFGWLDDKVVSFTNAYLKIQFAQEYQRENLVTDPVAGVRFAKTVAHSCLEHGGHTYHFQSEESRKRFEANPDAYVQS